MNEIDVLIALRPWVRSRTEDRTSLFVEELGVCQGDARIDLAVINGTLSGFEVKAERDNLSRLIRQAEVYGRCLERVTIVCGERHLASATSIVPTWWGVVVAAGTADAVELVELRSGRPNPAVDPLAMAMFLWRGELHDELRRRGATRLSRATRSELAERLVSTLSTAEVSATVRRRLRQRPGWPPGP